MYFSTPTPYACYHATTSRCIYDAVYYSYSNVIVHHYSHYIRIFSRLKCLSVRQQYHALAISYSAY